ncbi:hypothetical protein [Cyclobacterium sp.]|uniref:hypothetical protein n=1 Tax=Cyclobacterium sp. TaxID=1966343 RepID=UPI001988B289|nr:hypothetical protein [Cyclobacterium sp.]MBD3629177.1 hypothetical protein [Cyclobacterium sp.]
MKSALKGFFWVFVAICSGVSCNKEEQVPFSNPTQIDAYFPLTDFLEQKIENSSGDEVIKTIRFNEEEERVKFIPDTATWRKELDFFFQADINKAALASAYLTKEEGQMLIHSLKPGEKNNIREIKVVKKGGKVSEIGVVAIKDNLFYYSEVYGELAFDENENLSSYSMEGIQKVWFLAGTSLEVQADIAE